MKTLKLIATVLGVICLNSAFSFSTFNLPLDEITSNTTEKLIVFDNYTDIADVVVPDKTNVQKKFVEDTILIDLTHEKIVSPFPNASRNCILQQIPYPEFARKKKLEGGVVVQFKFDENGVVHVLDACSNSPELENYVLNKLSNLQLKNCVVDINKDYYMRFMFRLL